MSELQQPGARAKWPFPPGHRRHGEPKEPSINAVWKMLEDDYGMTRPKIGDRIKDGESIEIGDYNENRKAFCVYLHEKGAPYPAEFWYEAAPIGDPATTRPRMRG